MGWLKCDHIKQHITLTTTFSGFHRTQGIRRDSVKPWNCGSGDNLINVSSVVMKYNSS